MKSVRISKELLWDYRTPPANLLWRLQRIADFFPAVGTEKEVVELLFKHRDALKLERGTNQLIALYHEVWREKTHKRNRKQ